MTGCGGFSLLELVVGLAIASIAMLAVVSVFTTLTRSYTTQTASAGLQQKARASLDYMAQNIRMAGLNPKRLPGAGIISADADSIQFNLDRNLNGALENKDEEHMRFYFKPGERRIDEELYTGFSNEHNYPLVGDVTDLTFNYFDENGDLLTAGPYTAMVFYLDPGEDCPFRVTMTGPAGESSIDNHEVYLDAETTVPFEYFDLSISDNHHYYLLNNLPMLDLHQVLVHT